MRKYGKSGVLFLLTLLVGVLAPAADKIYMEESDSYWGHPLIIKGTHIYSGSPEATNLEDLVRDNPTALKYAEQHSSYRTAFWITFVPWIGSLGLTLITQDVTTAWIGLGVFVAATIPLIHFESRSRYFLYKTINVYNGNEPEKESHRSLDIGVQVVSHEPGLGLKLQF